LSFPTIITNFLFHKKSRKERKKIEKKFKMQENIHEEILEDYSSWWCKTKTTSGKVEGSKCIRLTKLAT